MDDTDNGTMIAFQTPTCPYVEQSGRVHNGSLVFKYNDPDDVCSNPVFRLFNDIHHTLIYPHP